MRSVAIFLIHFLTSLVSLQGKELGFLDLMDRVFGKLTLTVGALLICLVVGWFWGAARARDDHTPLLLGVSSHAS